MKWGRAPVDTPAPGPNEPRSIIDRWNPLNKKDFSTAYMRELYSNLLRMPVAARAEEYSVPFPSYMDNKSYQRVVENGMFIRNHELDETVELV